jgi:hypothetical protein
VMVFTLWKSSSKVKSIRTPTRRRRLTLDAIRLKDHTTAGSGADVGFIGNGVAEKRPSCLGHENGQHGHGRNLHTAPRRGRIGGLRCALWDSTSSQAWTWSLKTPNP